MNAEQRASLFERHKQRVGLIGDKHNQLHRIHGMSDFEFFECLFMPEPNSGCWLWLGGMKHGGYGAFRITNTRKSMGAHRASWLLYKGFDPGTMLVCHRCDNRICVNPDHLFLGTHRDNCDDKIAKGRLRSGNVFGEKCNLSRLTAKNVADIKRRLRAGETQCSIAEAFGVVRNTIWNIASGRSWTQA